jgi:hypothetical protein
MFPIRGYYKTIRVVVNEIFNIIWNNAHGH